MAGGNESYKMKRKPFCRNGGYKMGTSVGVGGKMVRSLIAKCLIIPSEDKYKRSTRSIPWILNSKGSSSIIFRFVPSSVTESGTGGRMAVLNFCWFGFALMGKCKEIKCNFFFPSFFCPTIQWWDSQSSFCRKQDSQPTSPGANLCLPGDILEN